MAPMAGDHHQQMTNKHGCCPDKKDGEKPDDCCRGMNCCDAMKHADKGVGADSHTGHVDTH